MASQLFIRGTDRKVYGDPLFEDNAYYHANLNAMCVLSGKLDGFFSEGEPAYEEMLANIGRSIAHEISHAYDPNGSSYDENGYYDPWMKDEEYEKYLERVAKIKEFFDGMEIAEGVTLKGENICAETFADLMG